MPSPKPLPSADDLNSRLVYDPDTGELWWRNHGSWNRPAPAGCASDRYVVVRLSGRANKAAAHRIIWKMMTGTEPEQIDHINGDRHDNRWPNLRAVNNQENGRNRRLGRNNTSGHVGVVWSRASKRWVAKIRVDFKSLYLGGFVEKDDAIAARREAEERFGFHPNHGRTRSIEPGRFADGG